MSNNNEISQFKIGYNGWVAITKPDTTQTYANKARTASTCENFDSDFKSYSDKKKSPLLFLQVLSASVTKQVNIPLLNSYYKPFNLVESDARDSTSQGDDNLKESKSSIKAGYGTVTFSGQVDFEMTQGALSLLSNNTSSGTQLTGVDYNSSYGDFFSRQHVFHMQFFDGNRTCTLLNCVWNNFSINCQPNSLVTASLSFQSNNGFNSELFIANKDLRSDYTFDDTDLLIPYWQTGNDTEMTRFNVSFQRDVQPVFLNNEWLTPSYLKPGNIKINLNATHFDYYDYFNKNDLIINIGQKKIHFNTPVLTSQSYGMSNMNDTGEKSYQLTALPIDNTKCVFCIVKNNLTNS